MLEFGSAAADRGLLKELEAIIAVVIGGTLLTGGYGTVLGAIIFGVVQQGHELASSTGRGFQRAGERKLRMAPLTVSGRP